jgi:hypothetical protein
VSWAHTQGVDPPSLGNMGTLESLNDLIDMPMDIHVDQHEEEHKERGVFPRMGHTNLIDATIDGCIGSTKGCISLFGSDGSSRDATHPNDMKIHKGEIWNPYKITRAHNEGR